MSKSTLNTLSMWFQCRKSRLNPHQPHLKQHSFTREMTCLLKLTWGISRILTGALKSLKSLRLNGILLTKVYNVWAKTVQRSHLWWLKSDAKFEEKLTCSLKNDTRNLANFHHSTKSRNWDFDGILLSKVEDVWA